MYEGGIATPLIVHWPAGIERRGDLEHQSSHLIDIMATNVDVAGAEYPKRVAGHDIKPLEGRSLVSVFEGRRLPRRALYWEYEGNRAVRVGKWKLVAKENESWELYDMTADRTEARNLARAEPGIVRTLGAMWEAYAARADVLPLGGWRR